MMYISGDQSNVGGIFDSLTKLVGGAANTVNKIATGVVQGKQAYDATKAAWQGVPYSYPAAGSQIPQTTFPPYAAPQAPTPVQIPTNRALTKAEVAAMQQTLNVLGFNTGVVDGIVGPNTRAGIQAFQSARGLKVDGYATPQLFNEIMKVAAPAASDANVPQWQQTFPGYSTPAPSAPAPAPTPQGFNIASLSQFALPAAAIGALILLAGRRR